MNLENSLIRLNVDGVHNWLEGINYPEKPEEVYYGADESSEKHVIKFCNIFKEKFGKKLDYRFEDGLCYLKYKEERRD